MNADNVKQLLEKYLESMQALPAPNLQSMSVLTLSELRKRTKQRFGKQLTQIALADAIGKGESTIQQWESGINLGGITALVALQMAYLFGCRIEEVIAAIENTRLLKEESTNLHITNN